LGKKLFVISGISHLNFLKNIFDGVEGYYRTFRA